ncbi:MAG: hypothetical protein EOO38_11380 [Cytophagaceae bacterium]|nr:MAG: hypothetical protein EOO38_11380 [Cytophagaceae bacterium]
MKTTVTLSEELSASNKTLHLAICGPLEVHSQNGSIFIECRLADGTPVRIVPHDNSLKEFAVKFAEALMTHADSLGDASTAVRGRT